MKNHELFDAIKNGDFEKMRKLLKPKFWFINLKPSVDINLVRNKDGLSPLNYATLHNKISEVERLISYGAKINDSDTTGDTPLHVASKNGYKELVELLITNNSAVDSTSKSGDTPLHLAVRNNKKEIIELLISKGSEINASNNSKDTPLHLAIQYAPEELIKFLISKGANINSINKSDDSPLNIAIQNNKKELIEFFLSEGYCKKDQLNSAILRAAKRSQIETVELLLSLKAEINTLDSKGNSLLHIASEIGNLKLIKVLIKNGININSTNSNGFAPIHIAKKNQYDDIVKLLQNSGASSTGEIVNQYGLYVRTDGRWEHCEKVMLVIHGLGFSKDDEDVDFELGCMSMGNLMKNMDFQNISDIEYHFERSHDATTATGKIAKFIQKHDLGSFILVEVTALLIGKLTIGLGYSTNKADKRSMLLGQDDFEYFVNNVKVDKFETLKQ